MSGAVSVTEWLLESDPAIRWQVLRDLTDEPADVVAAERARVATEGWGARLLALQADDGMWGGGIYGPEWTGTTPTLHLLRVLGLDPASEPARRAIGLVRGLHWEEWDNLPYFAGEVEPCINGGILALAAYFGEIGLGSDRLVERLLGEQLEDGGWNCWAPENSRVSSFHSTINVLEGFLEYERTVGPAPAVAAARQRGEEYLLERRLFRSLRTGQVINPDWTQFSFPTRWYYDVLRGLEYLRAALPGPDERCAEAIELVLQKRQPDGRWLLENPHDGGEHFDTEPGTGQPSHWITLRAMRVLRWSGRVGDSR